MDKRKRIRKVVNKFGERLDTHYGINDFGCKICKELVNLATEEIMKIMEEK